MSARPRRLRPSLRSARPGAPNRQETLVKYMLLIYNNPEALAALPEAERNAIFADVDAIMTELKASGELVGGEALADPVSTKTVRPVGGTPVATDGPFLESKEQFAGFLTIDVETEERAVEIASRWPDGRFGAMEVRAIMHTSGEEM